tara:strand:+ start:441 stop:1352 length:912 start_codon:yes stop_codon:yes gene_type:complete
MGETQTLFKKMVIIGGGLIGSSVARAVSDHNLCDHLTIADKNQDYLNEINSLDICDEAISDLPKAVNGADFVLICVPVGAFEVVLNEIKDHVEAGAIISDVGSVKTHVNDFMFDLMPDNVFVIPGHPIAGTEKSGPKAGFAQLFKGRWMILTPRQGYYEQAALDEKIKTLKNFWERCGSKVEIMDEVHHDDVLAMTSHLPHLVAFSVMNTAAEMEEETREEILKFSAGGFRDFTRVAASDPTMWRDVFLSNKKAMLPLLQRFVEDLTILQKHIRQSNGDALFDYFTKAKSIRSDMNFDETEKK